MKLPIRAGALIATALLAGAASAQDVIAVDAAPWKGFYAGGNIGGIRNSTCNSWTPNNGIANPVIANAFYNRDCPNNSTFIGGIQIGYNFQYDQWVWGFGLDVEGASSKTRNRTHVYAGPTPPPDGTYAFNGKFSPDAIVILGPRIGYAIDHWLPYVRIGGVYANGSHNTTASFTDANGTSSFSGGKNFKSSGFGAGAGVEYALADPWSLRFEYTYVKLGKSTNTATQCTGSTATCAEFDTASLDNIHNSFTASMFRFGVNYKFDF